MAKYTRQMSFTNCEIDLDTMMLTEHNKDGDPVNRYRLYDIFSAWNCVPGVNMTIALKDEMPTIQIEGQTEEEENSDDEEV